MSLLILTWFGVIYYRRDNLHRFEQNAQAFYLAEAGVQKAQWLLAGNGGKTKNWRGSETFDPISVDFPGRCTITVLDAGAFVQVKSTGQIGSRQRSVSARLGQIFQKPPAAITCQEPPDIRPEVEITGGQWQTALPEWDFTQVSRAIAHMRNLLANPNLADVQIGHSVFYTDVDPPPFEAGSVIYILGDLHLSSGGGPGWFDTPLTFIASNILVDGTLEIRDDIQLIARHQLTIAERATLPGAQLYSSETIICRNWSRISGQVLSTGQITLLDEAQITGNSLLYIEAPQHAGKITLADRSRVDGSIIYHGYAEPGQTQVEIGTYAHLRGFIYATGHLWTRGTIEGYLITHSLTASEGRIDATQAPVEPITLFGYHPTAPLGIVQWEALRPFW